MLRYYISIICILAGIGTTSAHAWTIKICNSKENAHDIRLGWAAWSDNTVLTVEGEGEKTYDSGGYCVNKIEIKPHGKPASDYRPVGFRKTGAGMACRNITLHIDLNGRVWDKESDLIC